MSIEKKRLKGAIQRFLTPKTRFVKQRMNGHDIVLDLEDEWIRNNYLWRDIYEPQTTMHIEQNVRPNDIVLDIGAHIGYHSLNFARAGAHVVAFEPDSQTFDLLCFNSRSKPIAPLKQIISDTEGPVVFYKSEYGSAWNSLIPLRNSTPVKLQSTTIDSLNLKKVDWVKVDVEGAELQVLNGMKRTLQRFPNLRLILEWLPKNGGALDEIINLLSDWSCKPLDHNMLFWRECDKT